MSRYAGATVALLTQHGKESVIGPLFAERLGATVVRATGFDTDQLGTFTRDVPRPGSQLDAARTKAQIGMDLLGLDVGVASEGSVGPDPYGVCAWDIELVALVDRAAGIEVVGRASGPAVQAHTTVRDLDALRAFAPSAGFPAHGLVIRADSERGAVIRKGVTDDAALADAFAAAAAASASGAVFAETDARAHVNPTRMALIRRATEDLVTRLLSACPACGAPGFACVERLAGAPCAACGLPTRVAAAERWACLRGDHEERRPTHRLADPSECDACNP